MAESPTTEEIATSAEVHIKETSIPGLYLIEMPQVTKDPRGPFSMVFLNRELEAKTGKKFEIAQWNRSISKPSVIRGIHPDPWNKIVLPQGKIFAAIAVIDPISPHFKKVETFTFDETQDLESETVKVLYVSAGLGNSFCNWGNGLAYYYYIVDDYWDGTFGSGPRGVSVYDPDLGIKWPVKNPILSANDAANKTLREQFGKQFPHLFK